MNRSLQRRKEISTLLRHHWLFFSTSRKVRVTDCRNVEITKSFTRCWIEGCQLCCWQGIVWIWCWDEVIWSILDNHLKGTFDFIISLSSTFFFLAFLWQPIVNSCLRFILLLSSKSFSWFIAMSVGCSISVLDMCLVYSWPTYHVSISFYFFLAWDEMCSSLC